MHSFFFFLLFDKLSSEKKNGIKVAFCTWKHLCVLFHRFFFHKFGSKLKIRESQKTENTSAVNWLEKKKDETLKQK